MHKRPESAATYVLSAQIFTGSAQRLAKCFSDEKWQIANNPQAAPLYYLVSHAAELFLKALVVSRDLRIQWEHKHDIVGLLGELEAIEVKVTPASRKVLEELSSKHKGHSLRYDAFFLGREGGFQSNEQQLFTMLEELERLAGRKFRTGRQRWDRLPDPDRDRR
jgi:hypothetical protein